MKDMTYTLASYRVRAGREADFVALWSQLADTFSALPNPPVWGTLIRNLSDRSLFYSFGPWRSREHVRLMRENPKAGEMFGRIAELCEELSPGDYEIVTHVDVADRAGEKSISSTTS